jgi:LacI family transcriptional regulator
MHVENVCSTVGPMTRNHVTLREVARIVGVSTATVSRALHPDTRPLVNEETALRIEEAAQRVGYAPNSLARGLKTKRSFTVGAIIPDLTNPLFPPMVRGIQDRLEQDGYTALIASTDGDAERERRSFEALRARQVDGLILATAERRHPVLDSAIAADITVVLVNRAVQDAQVDAVVPDDRGGIDLAVGHLADLGHVRIAHLAGPGSTSSGRGRREGFRAAMRKRGLDVPPALVQSAGGFTEAAGHQATAALLESRVPFTAIVAANDLLALGAYSALGADGRRCPEDVSVVGFNDMPFADRFAPPLTTVHIGHDELGARAADLLLEQLREQRPQGRRIVIDVRLVVRGSTRRLS